MNTPTQPLLHRLRDLIAADPDRFARGVFTRLFGYDPDLREKFPAQMGPVRSAFTEVVQHVLDALPRDDGHAELIELLAQLGRDHRKYDVADEHYTLMFRALTAEFQQLLGDDWTAETSQTVIQAMMLTTGVMRGAAQSAPGPATWHARVVAKFVINRELAVVRLIADGPRTRYHAGQYLEVQIPQLPRLWRNLSPAVPPNDNGQLEFHVRAVPDGQVSAAIVTQTQVGDVWTFAQPHGTMSVRGDKPVLMIAGGTGLAPLRAILLGMAARADNPPTHLFYGARYPGELYEAATLAQIAATSPWLTVTLVAEQLADAWWIADAPDVHQWGLEVRYGKAADVALDVGDWTGHQVLIAGPASMVFMTDLKLRMSGVPADAISHDPVS